MAVKHSQNLRAELLASLHQPGNPLLLSNVWDAASASIVASHPTTKALATASFAIAATQGYDDNDMDLEANLAGVCNVIRGLTGVGKDQDLPLSVDLQDGYEDPAETVRRVIEMGVVGCNLEDVVNGRKGSVLRTLDDMVLRIRTMKLAAATCGVPDFVINARTDALGYEGHNTIAEVIRRGKEYLEAGATTVFVWGVLKWDITEKEVQEMVDAFDGRLAVQPGNIGVERLRELGVARISVGPALWRKSMSVIVDEGVRIGTIRKPDPVN